MTKEEIIALVQECTARLGHAPTTAEFLATGKVTRRQVRKLFGTHTRMLAESGVQREGGGYPIPIRSLFLDWAGIVRSLGKVPTLVDYERLGKYSPRPLTDRFGSWRGVPAGLLECARREELEGEWQDVLDIIALHQQTAARSPRTPRTTSATSLSSTIKPRSRTGAQTSGSPDLAAFAQAGMGVYGRPLPRSLLSYAPTNEAGVVLLFGSMARDLGFVVMRAQMEFPDCEALRQIEPNRWQKVRIEFEYESRSFLRHMHPAGDCDLIVCWSHNWPDCPLEVLELQGLVGEDSRDRKTETLAADSRR